MKKREENNAVQAKAGQAYLIWPESDTMFTDMSLCIY
jgi:hypothetical protein